MYRNLQAWLVEGRGGVVELSVLPMEGFFVGGGLGLPGHVGRVASPSPFAWHCVAADQQEELTLNRIRSEDGKFPNVIQKDVLMEREVSCPMILAGQCHAKTDLGKILEIAMAKNCKGLCLILPFRPLDTDLGLAVKAGWGFGMTDLHWSSFSVFNETSSVLIGAPNVQSSRLHEELTSSARAALASAVVPPALLAKDPRSTLQPWKHQEKKQGKKDKKEKKEKKEKKNKKDKKDKVKKDDEKDCKPKKEKETNSKVDPCLEAAAFELQQSAKSSDGGRWLFTSVQKKKRQVTLSPPFPSRQSVTLAWVPEVSAVRILGGHEYAWYLGYRCNMLLLSRAQQQRIISRSTPSVFHELALKALNSVV